MRVSSIVPEYRQHLSIEELSQGPERPAAVGGRSGK
jgi:hypothetical protein